MNSQLNSKFTGSFKKVYFIFIHTEMRLPSCMSTNKTLYIAYTMNWPIKTPVVFWLKTLN